MNKTALDAAKGTRIVIRAVKVAYTTQAQEPGRSDTRTYIITDEHGHEHLWHSSHLARQPRGHEPYTCDVCKPGDGDLYLTATVNHRWGGMGQEKGYYLLRGKFWRGKDEGRATDRVVAEFERR